MIAAVRRVAPCVVGIETVGGMERAKDVLLRHGPDHRAGDRSARLHRLQRLQFRQQAGVDPRAAARRHAQAGQARGHRSQPHARAVEDRGRPAAAGAGNRRRRPKCAWGSGASPWGGRFKPDRPNMAVGMLSATGRIWGKALQTDAAVSPNNYGGPLVDIRGRVLGVLVPLSPQSADEMAGYEWYDSGIGFAVPAEHVCNILPRLKQGRDLYTGLAGFSLRSDELFTRRGRDRRLPRQFAGGQGRPPRRRPDRGNRRAEDRAVGRIEGRTQPPLRRRQGRRRRVARRSSGLRPKSNSSPSSPPINRRCWACCRCGPDRKTASPVRYVYPQSPAAAGGNRRRRRAGEFGRPAHRQSRGGDGRGLPGWRRTTRRRSDFAARAKSGRRRSSSTGFPRRCRRRSCRPPMPRSSPASTSWTSAASSPRRSRSFATGSGRTCPTVTPPPRRTAWSSGCEATRPPAPRSCWPAGSPSATAMT